jgi:hypothetical protein
MDGETVAFEEDRGPCREEAIVVLIDVHECESPTKAAEKRSQGP